MNSKLLLVGLLTIALFLAGCVTNPNPENKSVRIQTDQTSYQQGKDPIKVTITNNTEKTIFYMSIGSCASGKIEFYKKTANGFEYVGYYPGSIAGCPSVDTTQSIAPGQSTTISMGWESGATFIDLLQKENPAGTYQLKFAYSFEDQPKEGSDQFRILKPPLMSAESNEFEIR